MPDDQNAEIEVDGAHAVIRPVRTRKREHVNTRNRLLGLLAIVVAARLGLTRKAAVFKSGPDGWDHPQWKRFITGEWNLPEENERILAENLKRTIIDAINADTDHKGLTRDLCFFRSSVLKELGPAVDYLELTGRDDQYQLDRELLYALDIDFDDKVSKRVHSTVHGFWYVIRFATRDECDGEGPHYRVALLSINSNSYLRLMRDGERKVPVDTAVPHFTLRTERAEPDGEDEAPPIRGQIIQTLEPKPVLNFMGAREANNPPMLFMMTLKPNDARPHASEAHGLVLMSNNQTIISGPIGACFVPLSRNIQDKRAEILEKNLAEHEGLSLLYRKQRRDLAQRIGLYSEQALQDQFATVCTNNSLRNVLKRLNTAKEEAAKDAGFYSISNG